MPEENEDQELQGKIQDGGDPPPDIEIPGLVASDVFQETEEKIPDEKEVEKKEKKAPEVIEGDKDQIIKTMQQRLDEQERSLRRLHYEERHKKKESEVKEEAPLTDEQLLKFMEDAGDDKASLLRVMKYAAENAAKGAKKSALSEAELMSKKKEVDGVLRNIFKEKWDDPTSDVKAAVDGIKTKFGIEDHPYGDFFGVAVGIMDKLPQLQKQWFEAGKQEATKGLSEDERKKAIDQNNLGNGKKKGGGTGTVKSTLSEAEISVAKKLGYGIGNPKKPLERYASILKSQRSEA